MELEGKKVVVTGADGFIGSHLTEALVAHGCAVTAFCFYNSFDSWGWLDSLPAETTGRLNVVMGDIRDPNGVRAALTGADVVFHLAALIGIPYSYHAPASYIATNVSGPLNILEACRASRVRRLVVTSTSEVYG
ncbi:MAG: GDP-mannose 4,6-dehydratase, partial [Actinomycetes bacterium]